MTINHQRVFRGFSSSEILEEFSESTETQEEDHQDVLNRTGIESQYRARERHEEEPKGWK